MTDDQEVTRLQVEKARQELDSVLNDEEQHVILISMNSRTQLMAIHTVNIAPQLAGELLKLSALHTQEANNSLAARMHMN